MMGRIRQFAVLVAFKTLAELRAERQRTYLGFLWWFFEPAFFMGVFYFVFSVLMDRGGPDYVAVLLVGLILWQWFSSSIMHCSNSVRGGVNLLRSVPLAAALFPLATFAADSVKFLVVLLVLFVILMVMGHTPGSAWLAFPVVLLAEFAWACGVSLFVAAVVPFVPDLRFVITPILQGLFFLSAIFYSLDSVSPEMRHWLEFDPIAVIVDCARQILLYNQFPDPWRIGRMLLAGLVVLVAGGTFLHAVSHHYAKLAD